MSDGRAGLPSSREARRHATENRGYAACAPHVRGDACLIAALAAAVHDGGMCRWNAYFGQPVADRRAALQDRPRTDRPEPARPDGRRDDQRRRLRAGLVRDQRRRPGRYRSVTPAWSDVNLRDLAAHIESPLFLAHIRATTGTPVQQTNCHPFRHGRWLFVHNGVIDGFRRCAANCCSRSSPRCSTTSRVHRLRGALLSRADLRARGRPAGRDGTRGRLRRGDRPRARRRAPDPDDGRLSDGERLWAIRYSTEHQSRTLFVSERRRRVAQAPSRQPAPAAVHRRGPRRRLRAARRPAGRMARDPGVDGADHPARRRRTTAVQPALAIRDRRTTMSTPDTGVQGPRERSTTPEGAGSSSPGSC